MNTQDVQNLYQQFILPTYKQLPVCLVKGKGSKVWDLEGREYLDFFPGWGVSGLGHCHPAVVNALRHQIKKIIHISNNFLNLEQAKLAREIVQQAFPGKVFFCNSGAEATDAAVKYARKYGQDEGRYEIITFKQSFHGRTVAAITATGQEKIQKGFEPLLEGFRYAEFNNLESVKSLISKKTVAVFLEPIQGEGGIHVATPQFMKGLRQLCNENKILLMLDEVQTAMGRTGKMFAYQHYDIEPCVMTLAKSLGNGVPIGALWVNGKLKKEIFTPGSHGSTYGGNPMVAATALAVFKAIKKEGVLRKAVELGDYLKQKLDGLKEKYSVIKESRGMGLMRALELSVPGTPYAEAALAKRLIINCTQDYVLRIMPAITVTKKQIDQATAILDQVFQELKDKK